MAGASFINLAYLIEISVVLNLAYRELKFPDLYEKKLKNSIQELRDLAKQEKITTEFINTDLDIFTSLETSGKDKKRSKLSPDIWMGHKWLESFYTKYILLHRLALTVVNFNIFFNVLMLILVTVLSSVELNNLWAADRFIYSSLAIALGLFMPLILLRLCDSVNKSYQKLKVFVFCLIVAPLVMGVALTVAPEIMIAGTIVYVKGIDLDLLWAIAFGILTTLTLIPIFFIRMSTKCEEFFYGKEGEVPGIMEEIKEELLSRRASIDEESVKDARSLTV